MKGRKHQPTKYNVITATAVTFGWRCAHPRCGIASKRFHSEEQRDKTFQEHLKLFDRA